MKAQNWLTCVGTLGSGNGPEPAAASLNAGKGARSRQGLMARWDHGNNHYWFYVNFNEEAGTYGIVRSRFFGVLMDDLPNSTGKVQNFQSTKPYYLEFQLVGNRMRGKVFDRAASGQPELVGDTGWVEDTNPHPRGVSAILFEHWIQAPFVPLEGSFANLTSTPCPRGRAPCCYHRSASI